MSYIWRHNPVEEFKYSSEIVIPRLKEFLVFLWRYSYIKNSDYSPRLFSENSAGNIKKVEY